MRGLLGILALAGMGMHALAHAADCVEGTPYDLPGPSTCAVPAGKTSVVVVAVGGAGGGGGSGGAGGNGGVVSATFPVSGGQIDFYVGGGGSPGRGNGGGGGGSSSVNVGTANQIVAGGGGGGGIGTSGGDGGGNGTSSGLAGQSRSGSTGGIGGAGGVGGAAGTGSVNGFVGGSGNSGGGGAGGDGGYGNSNGGGTGAGTGTGGNGANTSGFAGGGGGGGGYGGGGGGGASASSSSAGGGGGSTGPSGATYSVAANSSGVPNTAGGEGSITFTFPSPPPVTAPTAITNAASYIQQFVAQLNGTVNEGGGQTTVTFNYGPSISPLLYSAPAAQSPLASGAGNTSVSALISNLACNTTYHFQVTASNSAATASGTDRTFTTSACASNPPSLSVINSPQTYSGSAIPALVSCSSGGTVDSNSIKYNGSITVPSAAGTYEITADCAANGNYSALTNASAGNFLITPARPTISVNNSPQTYTGSAIPAQVSCSSGGVVSNILYNGTSTVPSAPGVYAITANCAANGNYSALTNALAGAFLIRPAALASIPSLSEWTLLMLALMVLTMLGWHFHSERSY